MKSEWELRWAAVEAIGVVLAFVANGLVLWMITRQLRSDKKTRDLDHEHRRKESTFTYWRDLQGDALSSRRLLTAEYGRDEMTEAEAKALVTNANSTDATTREKYSTILYGLRDYLNGLERLAVAIEMGVFDLDVVDTLGNTTVRRAWERNHAYIEQVQKEVPDGRQYAALGRLHGTLNGRYVTRQNALNGGAAPPMGRQGR